jgi:hypothetical protein
MQLIEPCETMLDAHSIRIMKRTSECRIHEHVWMRHNAYGRRSISCICDAHLMGIKCTCEGGIHRFTMYLKRIRKRNTVEQHQVVSLRSQIVGV